MDITSTVTRYLAAWNQTDPGKRRADLEDLLAADARYVDPLADVTGPAELAELIGSVQATFGGLPLTLHGPIDSHHDTARFSWALGAADTDPVAIGFDVVTVDADGRLRSVLGFLDKVPG